MGSTEIMLKEGGTAWQQVADLPSARYGLRGVGLDNGKFLVTGQGSNFKISIFYGSHKVDTMELT